MLLYMGFKESKSWVQMKVATFFAATVVGGTVGETTAVSPDEIWVTTAGVPPHPLRIMLAATKMAKIVYVTDLFIISSSLLENGPSYYS
jgi:hypothetical protein